MPPSKTWVTFNSTKTNPATAHTFTGGLLYILPSEDATFAQAQNALNQCQFRFTLHEFEKGNVHDLELEQIPGLDTRLTEVEVVAQDAYNNATAAQLSANGKMSVFTAQSPMFFDGPVLGVDTSGFPTNTDLTNGLNTKVDKINITGATKSGITYNAQGQITAAVDLATADIPALPQSKITNLTTDLAAKASLASPALSGTPTSPTAAPGTSTTQIASTAFVSAAVALAVTGLLEFIGNIDCSANPNYPAANKGDTYYVNVAGKIGGASGLSVDIGDTIICKTDNAGGTQASVGASWFILEHNLTGALLAANNLSDLNNASVARTNLGLSAVAASGAYADLSGKPSLATVATSGAYNDLTGKPTIPAAQVNADWSAVSGVAQVLNKPAIPAVISYFKTGGTQTTPTKKWIDVVTPNTGNGYSVDISSAGFSAILSYQVIAIRNTGTVSSVPNVAIKTVSTTAIVVNIIEQSTNLVTLLGVSVLSGLPTVFASTSGLSLMVIVEGV